MPADPPLEDAKCEKLLGPSEGEDATLEATDWPHIEIGRNVCWNKSNTMLVSQTQHLAGNTGNIGDTVPH